METLFILLMIASLILLVIGFISPKTSLFWYKKAQKRSVSFIIYFTILAASTLILIVSLAIKNGPVKSTEPSAPETKVIGIGDVQTTRYFAVRVNKVNFQDRVATGNEFADLKKEDGNKYLVINVTFKNTDNESRMLTDGSVFINYNGKDYEFDKSEVVMADGWGLLLDQINPLTSKTTNLVYKLPAEIKGSAYYQPGRADADQRIFLGNIQ